LHVLQPAAALLQRLVDLAQGAVELVWLQRLRRQSAAGWLEGGSRQVRLRRAVCGLGACGLGAHERCLPLSARPGASSGSGAMLWTIRSITVSTRAASPG